MLHFDPTFYGDGNAMYSGVACWRRPGTHWAVDRESNGASEGDASFIAPCKLVTVRQFKRGSWWLRTTAGRTAASHSSQHECNNISNTIGCLDIPLGGINYISVTRRHRGCYLVNTVTIQSTASYCSLGRANKSLITE